VARNFEEQARVQQAQHEMLQAQQQSISDLKQMITLLLKKKTKSPKIKASSSKGKGKEKEDEDSTSEESNDTKTLKFSSEENLEAWTTISNK